MVKYLALILSTLFSANSFAECSTESCTQVKINRLHVETNGDVKVNTNGDESKLGCDSDVYGYLTLKRNSSNFDAVYSLLLAAKMADKEIDRIRTNVSGQCEIAYVIFD